MRPYRRTLLQIAIPLRPLLYRLMVALLVTSSAILLIVSHTNERFTTGIRGGFTEVLLPVLNMMAKPLDAIDSGVAWAHDFATTRSQMTLLKTENTRLLQWQATAKRFERENEQLKALLNVVPTAGSSYITAQVIGESGGTYARMALLPAGSDNGVRKDQAVITENGMAGRIIEVTPNSSRILLLTDANSRVPVQGELSRERAILAGNNTGLLSLHYLAHDTKLQVGERIVTAGDGGVVPPGIAVGTVSSVQGEEAVVEPLVDSHTLDYVSVVDFHAAK